MKARPTVPSDINSSLTVFYVTLSTIWAYVFSTYFPAILQKQAFILILVFALTMYVFHFAILQLAEGLEVLRMILIYISTLAVINVVSAVVGPLADGTIPVISMQLFGARLFTYVGPAYLTGSVFIFYGFITIFTALICASVLEVCYNQIRKTVPKRFKTVLQKTDTAIDDYSFSSVQRIFYTTEYRGLIAASIVVGCYAVAYAIVVTFTT